MRKPNTAKAAEAQDLRQRAARARDAAGRFIRRAAQLEASATPFMPDPVHALIEEHRAAYAEWDRLSAVWNDMEVDAPGYREAVAASRGPGLREIAAYNALFCAKPASLADAVALGAYLGEAIRKTSTYAQPTDAERALSTITAAVQRLDAPSISPHPDAALIALGAEFLAAWVAEDTDVDEDDTAYRACGRVAEQIARSLAVTAEGFGIKALLLARYASDDSSPSRLIAAQGPITSEWSVLRQVQEGAARLAAAAETGIPATGLQPTQPCAPARPELCDISVVQLARLYEVLAHAEQSIGRAENSPCFWNSDRTDRTAAGCIINWETDRLQRLASEIVQEISRRQPADPDEAEERANTLLAHLVLTGGVAEHPELIAEINATWGA